MNNTLMTPETAPRDLEQLTNQGPFIHRRLGEALEKIGFPCWTNEREKTAFVTASPADRAQLILTQLQAYDTKSGGPPAAPPPQAPPPAAQTAPAAPPAAPATGRQPRTGGGAGAVVNGGPAAAGNGAQGVGNVVELLNVLKAVQAQLTEAQATAAKTATAQAQLTSEVQSVKALLAAMMKIQEVQLGLLSLFGQQVLQAPAEAFLETAITDGASAMQMLQELTGKG